MQARVKKILIISKSNAKFLGIDFKLYLLYKRKGIFPPRGIILINININSPWCR